MINTNPPILSPEQYEASGLPSGYIYWPTANVFVHPSTIPEHFLCASSLQNSQKPGIQDFYSQENSVKSNANTNTNSKYRKILPKEDQTYPVHGTDSNNRPQLHANMSSSNSSPQENIFQFTR